MKHTAAHAIALRLLAGATIDFVDEHARRWRATATGLVLMPHDAPVLEGTAADVAIELLARGYAP